MVEAGAVVVALGAHSARLTSRFGYSPPMFGERGYHMHYGTRGNAVLNHPMMDMASGFMLSPMRAGIRLATGAEFARLDSAATPVQLERAEPMARKLLPLGGKGGGQAVARSAAVHAGHGAGDFGSAEASRDVGGVRAWQCGVDAGAEHRAAVGGDDGRGGDIH